MFLKNGGVKQVLVVTLLISMALMPVLLIWLYYSITGAFVSVETCMAVLQTNFSEASEYVLGNIKFTHLLNLTVFLSLFVFICYCIIRAGKSAVKVATLPLIVFTILNFVFLYRTRENLVMNIIYDTYKYQELYNKFIENKELRKQNLTQLSGLQNSGDAGLYVMVIGESATRDHMGCYGYNRNTTPWMSKMQGNESFYQFTNAWSCAVDTVHSLNYALTNKNQYNDLDLSKAISIVDVANASGYKTIWISNQAKIGLADTPITAIASEAKEQIWLRNKIGHLKDGRYLDLPGYYDDRIINALDEVQLNERTLIVIHMIGSHANYDVRYPKDFAIFKNDESYIDEYDNSILYTDSVLEKIYNKVKQNSHFKAFVYFSDHGEGIEGNLMHDINRYTTQMAKIPLVMIFSSDYLRKRQKIDMNKISQYYFTNDLIFDMDNMAV